MHMNNLIYHFPTCYAYSVKKPIGGERALDEDRGPGDFPFFFFSTGPDSCFWEFHSTNPSQTLSPPSVRRSVRRIRVRTRTNPCRPWVSKIILLILALSGDIEMNPGPVAYPCTVCSNPVKKNQRAILCSTCDMWSTC